MQNERDDEKGHLHNLRRERHFIQAGNQRYTNGFSLAHQQLNKREQKRSIMKIWKYIPALALVGAAFLARPAIAQDTTTTTTVPGTTSTTVVQTEPPPSTIVVSNYTEP